MTLDTRTTVRARTATITLTGDVDAASASVLDEAIAAAAVSSPRRLVLDLNAVDYLSSAGLRCLVFAHQRLGRGVEIVLAGAHPDVAETVRLAGFDRVATIEDQVGG
ncbi:STAS domain-containing protein [Umezawaea tangerina]|uniref:Anti-sigma factor antagonist n=1 Tax=Umezawaea tangerina TaxID=84725 RepID=A0A2T0STC2_9PSEU|nr:STAS domain-containing protein [Umezawaea tangerina]PRY36638.1 anti-anti-sigma factor [Umezawaea tangerina]